MDEVIFTYNEESALTAGQGSFITETVRISLTSPKQNSSNQKKVPDSLSFLENPTTDGKSSISVFVFRRMTVLKINLGRALFTP